MASSRFVKKGRAGSAGILPIEIRHGFPASILNFVILKDSSLSGRTYGK
ncbi:hypothetical protein EV217_5335 [Phyllobacterium myrsinacearum]|nr:hypothetical protein EV217_5335 [Phyllobacterium myrsinacearum]